VVGELAGQGDSLDGAWGGCGNLFALGEGEVLYEVQLRVTGGDHGVRVVQDGGLGSLILTYRE
jgi:hypothetical protein